MSFMTEPQIGQIVKVLRGKDEDSYAVIIGIPDHRFILIADGHKRRFAQPKKKNVQHVQLQQEVSSEVAESMSETGSVTNGKLRYAIQKYIERKGE